MVGGWREGTRFQGLLRLRRSPPQSMTGDLFRDRPPPPSGRLMTKTANDVGSDHHRPGVVNQTVNWVPFGGLFSWKMTPSSLPIGSSIYLLVLLVWMDEWRLVAQAFN